jgi:integrase
MVAKRDFTDRLLKAIKPAPAGKRRLVWDAQIPGFGIRVTERSSAAKIGSFVLITRFPGKKDPSPRRIGVYPAMPLVRAREIARHWRDLIAQGVDPEARQEQERREEERRRASTFSKAFATFAQEHLSTLRTGHAVARVVEKHVFPKWADRPVSGIRRAEVSDLVRSLRKEMRVGANRVLATLKTFFSWAVDQELVDISPAAAVKRPTREIKRDRVLNDQEIRAIWRACGQMEVFGRAFRTMLATAQRRTEVGNMAWSELNRRERLWTLPRERTKADRSHQVPLSSLALSIIEECPVYGDYVFSKARNGRDRNSAPPISGWSKAKAVLDKLVLAEAIALAVAQGDEPPKSLAEWHLHDLRRTAATYMAKLGVERVVIGKILNHAETEVTAIYDRHRYDAEKRRALDLWGEKLTLLVGQRSDGTRASETEAPERKKGANGPPLAEIRD